MNKDNNEYYIAGNKTPADWIAFRERLINERTKDLWREAFEEYFIKRLELRYLHPIKILQDNGTFAGEGFSIMAILCSLIEFLESTYQGKIYKYIRKGQLLGANEYSSSKEMFISFLKNRKPFISTFDENLAKEFYENIRCGLLHEASTKGGWRIWATNNNGLLINKDSKIVYRNNFEIAIREYTEGYGRELQDSPERQEAFIIKFNDL